MKLLTQWAFTSSILILIVLAVRVLFRNKLSARLRYALWGVVLLRLLVPFQVELPAPVSDSVPLLVSNAVPKVGQWEERSIPVFPEGSKPAAEFNFVIENVLEPGEIRPYQNGTGGQQRSIDGETITWYRYILSPEQIVLALWLAGAGLTGTVILLSNLRFTLRLRKRRERLEKGGAGGLYPPLQAVPVYTVEGLPSPCLFGVFRPAVYVTPEAAENPDTLRHVLAHELTHCAHFDHIWSLLRCLALALHWYNPLVWLAVVLSKRDGELACDEGAVARLGEAERIPYGRTLVDMVAARAPRPADLLSCSTAMTGGKKSIQQRVAQLVKKPETVKAALFAVIALVALSAVFVFAERAQPKVNTMFQDQLGLATSIHYGPPLYWSIGYPDPIANPELLSQAKEALSGFRYLGDDDPLPDLQEGLIHTSRMTLINDRAETTYTLLWQDGRTYLFPGDIWGEEMKLQEELGEGAHIQGVSRTMVSEPGVNVIAQLENLARQAKTAHEEAQETGYSRFLSELESARSIFVGQPMISSAAAPGLISDPDRLAQARELLSKAVPVVWSEDSGTWRKMSLSSDSRQFPEGLTQEDLEDMLFLSGCSILLCPGPEPTPDTEYRYFLSHYKDGGGNVLLQWDAELEENPKALAAFSDNVYSQLAELARTNGALRGDLTPAQIDRANEAFASSVETAPGEYGFSEISCFFTSSYADPTQIDLEEFLRYCPLAEEVTRAEAPEEYQTVLSLGWAEEMTDPDFLMPVPMWRYPREKVSALLQKYAGVTVDQLDWGDMLYVEEYDAFYNFTSDAGPGFFPCAGGQIMEDSVLLWSKPDENGDRCELVLRKNGDGWLIQSHHTIYER